MVKFKGIWTKLTFMRLLALALTVGAVLVLSACDDNNENGTKNGDNTSAITITVMGEGNISTITPPQGKLQMVAVVEPSDGQGDAVSWTVTSGTGSATINRSGVLTAKTDGTVTVRATLISNSRVSGTTVITIDQSGGLPDNDETTEVTDETVDVLTEAIG